MQHTKPITIQNTKRLANAALTLGIIGLVVPLVAYIFLFLTMGAFAMIIVVLGIVAGIIATNLGRRSRRTDKHSKGGQAGIVTGIISIVIGIFNVMAIGLIALLLGYLSGSLTGPNSARSASIAQIAEQKVFGIGEVAHIGAWDLDVTKVTRDYQPTAKEYIPDSAIYATDNHVDEYVLVEGTLTPNGKHAAVYLEPESLQLNNSYGIYSGLDGLWGKSNTASSFRGVFKIEKTSQPLKLMYDVTVYKNISLIVGTEGMPREQLTYTLQLT